MVTRNILLMQIDNFWQQHLKNMAFLKNSVNLRAYGQKNPLTEYKLDGYKMFLKMMSRIRRNAVYNTLLFTPRTLTKMSKERVQELIPSKEVRRQQIKELMSQPGGDQLKEMIGLGSEQGKTARTLNMARLALNVRQLLDARASLGELALCSFTELRESMVRAGLVTVGDQLRWANACSEFELLEDAQAGEVYIGLRPDAEPAANVALSPEEVQDARESFSAAMENPEFMQTVDQFSASPNAFLAQMKEAAEEQSWGPEDIQKMREMYAAAGIDVDELLANMNETKKDLPPAQREVVEYMTKMMSGDAGKAGSESEKADDMVKA
jgi:Asp-tRNA(Asn)/Glu-tRNA(Gln) amidotransferase C subunit